MRKELEENFVMKKLKGSLLLLVAAVIWGITFVAQSDAMEHIDPFTFNFVRFFIGACVMLPFVPEFRKNHKSTSMPIPEGKKKSWVAIGCILCGFVLFIASNLQQFGIAIGDSVGKAGFITSIYIILVPIIGVFFKKRTSLRVVISAAIALVGLYFLCIHGEFKLASSDILYIACAFFFSAQIIIISIYSPYISGAAFSAIEFSVAAVLNCIFMFIFEKPDIQSIISAYIPLLYAGVLACGVAYTFQILGQKELDPSTASLIMSLESVVSVIAGMLILKQMLTVREIIGCIIMLFATILAQLSSKSAIPDSERQKL